MNSLKANRRKMQWRHHTRISYCKILTQNNFKYSIYQACLNFIYSRLVNCWVSCRIRVIPDLNYAFILHIGPRDGSLSKFCYNIIYVYSILCVQKQISNIFIFISNASHLLTFSFQIISFNLFGLPPLSHFFPLEVKSTLTIKDIYFLSFAFNN